MKTILAKDTDLHYISTLEWLYWLLEQWYYKTDWILFWCLLSQTEI